MKKKISLLLLLILSISACDLDGWPEWGSAQSFSGRRQEVICDLILTIDSTKGFLSFKTSDTTYTMPKYYTVSGTHTLLDTIDPLRSYFKAEHPYFFYLTKTGIAYEYYMVFLYSINNTKGMVRLDGEFSMNRAVNSNGFELVPFFGTGNFSGIVRGVTRSLRLEGHFEGNKNIQKGSGYYTMEIP